VGRGRTIKGDGQGHFFTRASLEKIASSKRGGGKPRVNPLKVDKVKAEKQIIENLQDSLGGCRQKREDRPVNVGGGQMGGKTKNKRTGGGIEEAG